MEEASASQQIDGIVSGYDDWRGKMLARLRAVIHSADPDVVEEVKWKMPSLPQGRPVWSHNGMLCIAEVFKNDLKLVFVKGAMLADPEHLFNARLNSKTDRAIEFREETLVDEAALAALVREAAQHNASKMRSA